MPRLAFLGPALGRHPGWVTTQGEVLAAKTGSFSSQAELQRWIDDYLG